MRWEGCGAHRAQEQHDQIDVEESLYKELAEERKTAEAEMPVKKEAAPIIQERNVDGWNIQGWKWQEVSESRYTLKIALRGFADISNVRERKRGAKGDLESLCSINVENEGIIY